MYSGPQFFSQKIKNKILQQNFTVPKFPDLHYVCVYVSVHYMEGAMYILPRRWYVCVYMCPTWRVVCMCDLHGGCVRVYTHIHIHTIQLQPSGRTHIMHILPQVGWIYTFQNTHTFSTHSPCRTNTHIYHPLDKTHTTLYVHTFYVGQIHTHTTTS